MIITSINAKNVLKYTELALDSLPEKGIIAISGLNESGKSSIGETVCFALFGKTFSVKSEQIKKIIRWGEENCSVTLTFKAEDKEYRLYRYLDTFGNHSAKLSLLGEEKTPLARSPQDVDDAVAKVLGYDYDEFIESFYLAQREITSPHPHSVAIKTMAGVSALESVSNDFDNEIHHQKEMLEETQIESQSLQDELEELEFEEGHLGTLEKEKNSLETDLENTRNLAVELNTASGTYISNEGDIKAATGKKWRARLLSMLSLLLALTAGTVWGLITQKSELPQSVKLLETLEKFIPNWQESYINYIGITAAAFTLLLLIFWIRSASHKKRIKVLRSTSAELATAMAIVRSVAEYEMVPRIYETPGEDVDDTEPVIDDSAVAYRYDHDKYAALLPAVESVNATGSEVTEYAQIEQQWLADQISLREENCSQVSEEVDEELARVRHVERIQEMGSNLQNKSEQLRKKLALREKAIELLAGAGKHFSNKFNRDIQDIMSTTLPVFTQNRYEHLRMEPDFGIRVFSNDKLGFLDLEEISSGTQRQIMLALRLALSQKLMARTVKGKQFAFLDEPFAFFDDERTRHALLALEELSDTLSQIWIVSQRFPDEHNFAADINCSRDTESLSYNAE